MDSVLLVRHCFTVLFLFISLQTDEAGGSRDMGSFYGKRCQNFKDCNSGQTQLICENTICQCASFQYYEDSLKKCVSSLDERCELEEPKDDLPKLICGPTASCIRARHEHFPKCRCTINRVRTLDGKCGERPTTIRTHAPAPRVSHPNLSPSETQDQSQLKAGEDEDPPPFPFPNNEHHPGVKSDSNSTRTNLVHSYLLPAILFMLLTRNLIRPLLF